MSEGTYVRTGGGIVYAVDIYLLLNNDDDFFLTFFFFLPMIQLVQKTPLRVLHRRSLLDRVRYVYNIRTAKLNDHYFLMDLTTSAGEDRSLYCRKYSLHS